MNAGTSSFRAPQQTRSQQTLDRILSSSTRLIAEKSYDDVSIAEIASRANISVGGFYSRFANKEALFSSLLSRLGQETHEKIEAALSNDWSNSTLRELLRFIVNNNAEIYDKYRGVLIAVHLSTRVLKPKNDDVRRSYNEDIVAQLESLILKKRDEVSASKHRVAVRVAIACMSAMLRDAIVFKDISLYPKPANRATITRNVTDIMYHHLTSESS